MNRIVDTQVYKLLDRLHMTMREGLILYGVHWDFTRTNVWAYMNRYSKELGLGKTPLSQNDFNRRFYGQMRLFILYKKFQLEYGDRFLEAFKKPCEVVGIRGEWVEENVFRMQERYPILGNLKSETPAAAVEGLLPINGNLLAF